MIFNVIAKRATTSIGVVFDGNSWIAGSGAPVGYSFPAQTVKLLTDAFHDVTWSNFGVAGQKIDQMAADAATQIDTLAATRSILVGLEVVNQYGLTGDSIATIYAKYKAYFLARKAAGWQRVIALTPTPQGYYGRAGWEADRLWLITQMQAEFPALGIEISDSGSDSRLSNWANLTYYSPDKIHKNFLGQSVEAEVLYNKIIS